MEIKTGYNRRLAKVAVQCSADTFLVNQSLFLRINICGEIATFAKRQNVGRNCTNHRADINRPTKMLYLTTNLTE